MTRTINFVVGESELVDKLQELDLEVGARESLIAAIMEQHKFDTDASLLESIPFKEYQKEYQRLFREYKAAQDQVSSSDVLPAWVSQYTYTWRLDTINRIMYIDFVGNQNIPELKDYVVETRN